MSGFLRLGALVATGLLIGCGAGDEGEAPAAAAPAAPTPKAAAPAAPQDAAAQAQQIFETRCFTCHGKTGAGDGPGSAALTPKPRNFHDAEWQASISDEHIAQIIMYGGAAVGKAVTMPSNPDLMSKPDVVASLVAHVRSLATP